MTSAVEFEKVIIPTRFRGPPDSANGGYVCGLVAEALGGAAEVTLQAPPPLERPLQLAARDRNQVELWCDDRLLARGVKRSFELERPPPISWEEAIRAARGYKGFDRHPFPACFVCGPQRAEGDGLRIFAGPCSEHRVAAPWSPENTFCNPNGHVHVRFLWAALDCPGYFAVAGDPPERLLLGRMTARIIGPLRAEERCVVIGWPLSIEGRKRHCGTALYSETAGLCGEALSTWIEVRKPAS